MCLLMHGRRLQINVISLDENVVLCAKDADCAGGNGCTLVVKWRTVEHSMFVCACPCLPVHAHASIKCPVTGMAQKVLIILYLPLTVIKVHHCDRP